MNEDRLFNLKLDLDSVTSQQIDIAMSAARAFNGFMDGFERGPEYILESTTRLIEVGIESKEQALKGYESSILRELNKLDAMCDKELLTSQRHMLRPIVSLASKKSINKISRDSVDDFLDHQADFLLAAVKKDLN